MSKVNLVNEANAGVPEAGSSDLYFNADGKVCKMGLDGIEIIIEGGDKYYIVEGEGVKGDPMIINSEGKVRKLVNKFSVTTTPLLGITGTPIVFGNNLNATQGIVVIANNDESTPANNFVEVAIVHSYTGQLDAPFGDKIHATLGTRVPLAGTVTDKAMDKRPLYLRLSSSSFCIIAQTSAGASCYVYNVEIVDGASAIVLDKTFSVDDLLLDIPSRAIVDEGGTTVDNIYFFAYSSGVSVDSIQVYKLSISTENLTTFTPVELSCKVAHGETVPFKCTWGMSGPGNMYVAFNRSVDNVIIISHITENSSPVSISVVEHVQTETTDVTEFFYLDNVTWILFSAQQQQFNNNNYNFLSYTYDPTQADLGRSDTGGDFLYSDLLVEKRYDAVTTRILVNYQDEEMMDDSKGVYSISVCPHWYEPGMISLLAAKSNQTSIFRYWNEISIISFSDRLLVIDYMDLNDGIIVIKTFNQNIEYIVDGVDEGFQFAGFAQTDYTDGQLLEIRGVAGFSEAHSGLLSGFMYYLKMDGTLMSFQPSWDFVKYCFMNFYPANINSRSINVFYAIAENKLIQADVKGFLNSNYLDYLDSVMVNFVG